MPTRLIIDETSVYEIDEECERQNEKEERRPGARRQGWRSGSQEKEGRQKGKTDWA